MTSDIGDRLARNETRLKELLVESGAKPQEENGTAKVTVRSDFSKESVLAGLQSQEYGVRLQTIITLQNERQLRREELFKLYVDTRRRILEVLIDSFLLSDQISEQELGRIAAEDWMIANFLCGNVESVENCILELYFSPLQRMASDHLQTKSSGSAFLARTVVKLFCFNREMEIRLGPDLHRLKFRQVFGSPFYDLVVKFLDESTKELLSFPNKKLSDGGLIQVSSPDGSSTCLFSEFVNYRHAVAAFVCFECEDLKTQTVQRFRTVLSSLFEKLVVFPKLLLWSEWRAIFNGISYICYELNETLVKVKEMEPINALLSEARSILFSKLQDTLEWWISSARGTFHDSSSDDYQSFRTHWQNEAPSHGVTAMSLCLGQVRKLLWNLPWLSSDFRRQILSSVLVEVVRFSVQKFASAKVSSVRKEQFRKDILHMLSTMTEMIPWAVTDFGQLSSTGISSEISDFSCLKSSIRQLLTIASVHECSLEDILRVSTQIRDPQDSPQSDPETTAVAPFLLGKTYADIETFTAVSLQLVLLKSRNEPSVIELLQLLVMKNFFVTKILLRSLEERDEEYAKRLKHFLLWLMTECTWESSAFFIVIQARLDQNQPGFQETCSGSKLQDELLKASWYDDVIKVAEFASTDLLSNWLYAKLLLSTTNQRCELNAKEIAQLILCKIPDFVLFLVASVTRGISKPGRISAVLAILIELSAAEKWARTHIIHSEIYTGLSRIKDEILHASESEEVAERSPYCSAIGEVERRIQNMEMKSINIDKLYFEACRQLLSEEAGRIMTRDPWKRKDFVALQSFVIANSEWIAKQVPKSPDEQQKAGVFARDPSVLLSQMCREIHELSSLTQNKWEFWEEPEALPEDELRFASAIKKSLEF